MAKKLGSDIRIYFGGYEPGLSTTRIALGLETGALDTTCLPDTAERATADIRKDTVEWAGLFDDAVDDIDAAQAALLGNGVNVVSVLFGTATGNVAYAGTAFLLSAKEPAKRGELLKIEATFKPDQAWDRGIVQAARQTLTGSANTGTVDNTALSTAGGTWYVHAFAYSGAGTASVLLRHSTDGTTWATKDTLAGINGRTSAKRALTGTINRYTRLESSVDGTSVNVASILVRS